MAILRQRLAALAQLQTAATPGAAPLLQQVHTQLKPIVDVERVTARIALRSARPRDLSGLRDTLSRFARVGGDLGGSRWQKCE